jgi:hypothetical protein
MRELGESSHSPQGREPEKQPQVESESLVQLLPPEATSSSSEMQYLPEAARWEGLLRHAPSEIPEAWRSTGGEIESAPSEKKMYNRRQNGRRRLERGNEKGGYYVLPKIANPGNIVKVIVGGGVMGSKLAHLNEAPFPERLAEWFIKGWCKPGGTVLDCFSGSATTARVARRLGRVGIGMDLRWSQCELGTRRLAEPEKPAKRAKKARPVVQGDSLLFPLEVA